ncbi:hypothetical protein N802_05680 [Knoellia sinensis KCTC 19936]|uniref:Carbohydrate kinase FGGY N-terminal domain-containing protein n=1 Tax=Knoellia sinensis KCTC 19936 TaxID=1385520 RepID=A0A0A0J5J0_9MICO|nr:hypothetical protein N802_05680 [Knoellia sinensis KCTC 19936]
MAPNAHPPAEAVIGLDVGTTGTKAVAFGLGSDWRHTVVREYPLLAPRPGWQVQDPNTVVAAVMGALAEVITAAKGARVIGISVSTAMHGLIGLDEQLRPLTPLLTWADSRAVAEAAELRASSDAEAIHRASGTPIHPMSPLSKLIWFNRNEPELAAKVRAWVGLKDYVLQALTGTSATDSRPPRGADSSTPPPVRGTHKRSSWPAYARTSCHPSSRRPRSSASRRPLRRASVSRRRPRSSSARATDPWATSAPAPSSPASLGSRSARVVPPAWSSRDLARTRAGDSSATHSPTTSGSLAAPSAMGESPSDGPVTSSATPA